MGLENEFEEKVLAHFKVLSPFLDEELAKIAGGNYENEVSFIFFEYDSSLFAKEFAVTGWLMDSRGNRIGEAIRLIQDQKFVVSPDIYNDETYEDIDPWDLASELFEK